MTQTQKHQNSEADPWSWSLWRDHMGWKNKLDRALAHKSLGIPDDGDMQVDNSKRGMTWKELAVIAGAGLGGYAMYQFGQSQTQTAPAVEAVSPLDSEYEVRFFDSKGEPITVKPLSQLEK